MAEWKLRGYAVETLLGRGASSEVWRARVAATGTPVALKRLFVGDPAQLRRAHGEAALLTVLDHPNLVRLHDLVTTPEAAVLVLDLADGGSLADLLAARGRLTPGEVMTAVAPVAAALAYVHRNGVVHGDVTPANLLFTPGGVALLADLGVARLTGDDSAAECTPAYIDPAVAVGGVPAAPSDVFMLGAVTLHALTGAPLWSGDDAASLLAAAREADVAAVPGRLAAAHVPAAMAEVVVRALSVDPARRCSAADFALDLRHSGTPVAVELRAGRRAVPPWNETAPKAVVTGYRARHAAPLGDYGRPAPTNAVSRSRPEVPRQPHRRTARLPVVAAVLLAAALAVAGWQWLARPAPPPHRPAAASPDWVGELRRLDALRARAFASGDPAPLRRVYADAGLLDADTALLQQLVAPGCGLLGVRTRYRDLRVSGTGRVAALTGRAGIPVSSLRCPGRPPRAVAAVATAPVRIVLVRTAAGPRIDSIAAG